MNKRKYSKTELGMMYEVMIGGAIGAVMLALTGEVLWLGAVGIGIALGLGIGASLDKSGGGSETIDLRLGNCGGMYVLKPLARVGRV